MRRYSLAHALGLGCSALITCTAFGQRANSASDSSLAGPTKGVVQPIVQNRVTGGGDEGGIAGSAPIQWDNGPLDSGVAATCATGTFSYLQNDTICLNIFGAGAQILNNNRMADDFTLSCETDLTTLEFYMYQTGATAVTITAMNVTLHSAQPANPTDAVLQSLTNTPVTASLTTWYRSVQVASPGGGAPACNRRIQKLVVDVSSWPNLAAGTYWLSWNAAGTLASGPWQAPVTILGQFGKPGANGMQSLNNGAFAAYLDVGGNPPPTTPTTCSAGASTPPAPGAPQDFPFIVRGNCVGGGCPGDTDGDSDVDADDLTNVILQWGNTCPCNADVDDDNDVDSDDLTVVILEWGTTC